MWYPVSNPYLGTADAVAHQPAVLGCGASTKHGGNRLVRRQCDQLLACAEQVRVGAEQQRSGVRLCKCRECLIDFLCRGSSKDNDPKSTSASRLANIFGLSIKARKFRIEQYSDRCRTLDNFPKQSQPFGFDLVVEQIDASGITAWPAQAGHKTQPDRIVAGRENDRDCLGCCFSCQSGRWPAGDNHIDPLCDQLSGECRQPAVLGFRPAGMYGNVLTFNIAGIFQTSSEAARKAHEKRIAGQSTIEPSDYRHRRLLRCYR